MRLTYLPYLAAFFLNLACAPETKAPVSVMALVLNNNSTYEAKEVQLHTIRDVVGLQGGVANLRGGAQVIIDSQDPLFAATGDSPSDKQLEEILLKNPGQVPRANYITKGEVLWPADFHTWNMVTTYYNFEQSLNYFKSVYDKSDTSEIESLKVLYFPEYIARDESPRPKVDNALFFSAIQAFVILPFRDLQKVPLSVNIGVIGHEYAHKVFNQKVYGGAALPIPLNSWNTPYGAPAFNLLRSLDEGLADFHGLGVTCQSTSGCQTQFLRLSLGENLSKSRDFTQANVCLTAELSNALSRFSTQEFDQQSMQYRLGTVVASALFQAATKSSQLMALQQAVIRSYDNPNKKGFRQVLNENLKTPEQFNLEAAVDILLANIPDDNLRSITCSEFWTRLRLNCTTMPCAALPNCPLNTTRGNSCQ